MFRTSFIRRFLRYFSGVALLATLGLSLVLMREAPAGTAPQATAACPMQVCGGLTDLLWGTLAAFSDPFGAEQQHGNHFPWAQ